MLHQFLEAFEEERQLGKEIDGVDDHECTDEGNDAFRQWPFLRGHHQRDCADSEKQRERELRRQSDAHRQQDKYGARPRRRAQPPLKGGHCQREGSGQRHVRRRQACVSDYGRLQ